MTRRIQITFEVPDDSQAGTAALDRFIAGLAKSFGLRCISIVVDPETNQEAEGPLYMHDDKPLGWFHGTSNPKR